jgi:hypothetical protein
MQRRAVRIGRRDRHQHVIAQALHRVLRLVEPAGRAGMAVAQHELHAALQHQVFAGARAVGDGLDRPHAQARLHARQPARERR